MAEKELKRLAIETVYHQSRSSLLCLPPAIRRRIYIEAHVIIGEHINLGTKFYNSCGFADYYGSESLLFVCRKMYAEVSRIIYAENHIIAQHQDPRMSLRAVRCLTRVSVSALTKLTICLNSTSCCLHGCCGVGREVSGISCPHRGQTGPLAISDFIDEAVIKEWRQTIRFLAIHATLSSLELHLVSDVYDYEEALQIVEPLQNLAKLRRCVVRLSHDPDAFLNKLAEDTALRATGHQTNGSGLPFRFIDLPREIRVQVLQFTDLVTPMKEVMWNPKDGYRVCYCIRLWNESAKGFFGQNSALEHSFHFRNCSRGYGRDCLCRRFHAASNSECHCWSPPKPLFLLCREVLDDARMVFFSQNRFIITSSDGPTGIAERTPERLEASIFLRDWVPFTSLCWLRSIEMVFPPFEEDYLRITDPAYNDWLQTISHVTEQFSIPLVDIHVHMADPETDEGQLLGGVIYRPNLPKERAMKIAAMYARTLASFRPWGRFKSFTMHLELPYGWNSTGYKERVCSHALWKHYTNEQARMERDVAHMFKGEDGDRVLRESSARIESQWLEYLWTKYQVNLE